MDDGSTPLGKRVAVEPLLAEHGDERGEKREGQTGIKDSLDVDDGGAGTRPLREDRIEVCWGVP